LVVIYNPLEFCPLSPFSIFGREMTRFIFIILSVWGVIFPLKAQQDPELIRLARLHGVAWLVADDSEAEQEIIKLIYKLSRQESMSEVDLDAIVSVIVPKAPKSKARLIDTTGLLLINSPYELINDPCFSKTSQAKLEKLLLGRGNGSVKKQYQTDKRMLDYDHNPKISELDSLDVLKSFLRIWSGLNYNYPYKHKLPQSWDSTFYDFLPLFTADSSTVPKVYLRQLRALSKQVNDGHISMGKHYSRKGMRAHVKAHKREEKQSEAHEHADEQEGEHGLEQPKTMHLPVFTLKGMKDGLYVDKVFESEQTMGIKRGDKVETVNGLSMEEIMEQYDEGQKDSRKDLMILELDRNMYWTRLKSADSILVKFEKYEAARWFVREWLSYEEFDEYFYSHLNEEVDLKGEQVVYLSLAEQSRKAFKSKMKKAIKDELPLIIDARNYPKKLFIAALPKYFSNKAMPVSDVYTPLKHYPGIYAKKDDVSYYFQNTTDLVVKSLGVLPMNSRLLSPFGSKKIETPVVVLIDESTLSWGETTAMLLKEYGGEQLTLIGRNTAGINGTVGTIVLAGNIDLVFTHYKLNDHLGNNFQHIGIPPDVYVEKKFPTENPDQDLILTTALEFLRERQAVMK